MSNLDVFLVGDGSQKLLERKGPGADQGFAEQIAEGLNSEGVLMQNDLSEYMSRHEVITLDNYSEVLWAFTAYKAEAYKYFGFTELKSTQQQGVPLKVEDLIISEKDLALIDYLSGSLKCLYTWSGLAYLQAFREMNIDYVRLDPRHMCGLCNLSRGLVFSVDSLFSQLCEGGNPVHPCCDLGLFPVLFRERYSGPLEGFLDVPFLQVGSVDLVNVPKEFVATFLSSDLFDEGSCLEVEFVNFTKWSPDDDVDLSAGTVVFKQAETLFVHNSYVADKGPIDFIKAYFNGVEVVCNIEKEKRLGLPQYVLNGTEVCEYNGYYYSMKTGERLV